MNLEFYCSNGVFAGGTDIYCNSEDLTTIGRALRKFPSKMDDEYIYEYGSENSLDAWYRYFLLRVYTLDSLGHCAIQVALNTNMAEPHEGVCRFSILADAPALNHLGRLFEKFSKLQDFEFAWTPEDFE